MKYSIMSIRGIKKFIFISFILQIMIFSRAFASEIDFTAGVDKNSISVGDVIKYTLTVKADKDVEFDFSEQGLNLGDFELLNFSTSDKKEEDGKVEVNYICDISIYNTGEYELPPVELKYKDKGEVKTKSTEGAIKITVETILPEDANEIKDIKPPQEIASPFPYHYLYILAGIIVVIILLTLLVIWIYRRYFKKSEEEKPVLPLLSPEEEAHRAMDELLKSSLLGEDKIKEFYTELSDIVRRYLERRFDVMTFEKTREEILEQLEKRLAHNKREFLDEACPILSDFDLVKFAKWIPSVSEAKGHVLKSRSFVDNTAVREEQEEGSPETPASVQEEE